MRGSPPRLTKPPTAPIFEENPCYQLSWNKASGAKAGTGSTALHEFVRISAVTDARPCHEIVGLLVPTLRGSGIPLAC